MTSSANYWDRKRLSRRRFIGGSGVALAGGAAILAGCGDDGEAKPSATASASAAAATTAGTTAAMPKKGGTIRWGIESDIATMDPVWTTATPTHHMAHNLYEPLFAYDANVKPQPMLVKDYTASPDKLTYTFNLRPDATFEGGRALTSADVIVSIQRWAKRVPAGVVLARSLNSLQAKGDNAFVLETKTPFGPLIDVLATGGGGGSGPYIMTKEAAATPADQKVDEVIASGPFRLAEWSKGTRIVLKPRADYVSGSGTPSNIAGKRTVYVDAVEIPILADDNGRISGLQAGTLDIVTQPSNDYYDQFKKDSQYETQQRFPGYAVVLLNNSKPPFSNVLARQALQAAIDVEKTLTAGFGDQFVVCPTIFLCGSANESKASIDQYNQKDLTKAKRLFQQLVDSGGYDGRPVTYLSNTTLSFIFNASQVVRQTLESIGFKVDFKAPDFATATTLRASKENWDLFHTGGVHGAGQNDPLRPLTLNPAGPGWYDSKEMQALQGEYVAAVTPEQQKAVLDKVQALWYKDVPHILIGQGKVFDVYRKYVKGFSDYPVWGSFFNVWLDK